MRRESAEHPWGTWSPKAPPTVVEYDTYAVECPQCRSAPTHLCRELRPVPGAAVTVEKVSVTTPHEERRALAMLLGLEL